MTFLLEVVDFIEYVLDLVREVVEVYIVRLVRLQLGDSTVAGGGQRGILTWTVRRSGHKQPPCIPQAFHRGVLLTRKWYELEMDSIARAAASSKLGTTAAMVFGVPCTRRVQVTREEAIWLVTRYANPVCCYSGKWHVAVPRNHGAEVIPL